MFPPIHLVHTTFPSSQPNLIPKYVRQVSIVKMSRILPPCSQYREGFDPPVSDIPDEEEIEVPLGAASQFHLSVELQSS